MDDRPGKLYVSEMAKALFEPLAVSLASQSGIYDSQADVHQAAVNRVTLFVIQFWRDNLGSCHLLDYLRREQPELYLIHIAVHCFFVFHCLVSIFILLSSSIFLYFCFFSQFSVNAY